MASESALTRDDVYRLMGVKVCGICSGTGKLRSYGFIREKLQCHFCDGAGTLPLPPAPGAA